MDLSPCREIQEQEAIKRAHEEDERRKKSNIDGAESLPKGLWNPAPLNTDQPPSLLGIINEQSKQQRSQQTSHPLLGGVDEFVGGGGILGWGPSGSAGEKASLTQIQEEEMKHKQGKSQPDSTAQGKSQPKQQKGQGKKQTQPQAQPPLQPQQPSAKDSAAKKQEAKSPKKKVQQKVWILFPF